MPRSSDPVRTTVSDKTDVEFWFDFASTYSYLSAMRIEKLVSGAEIRLRWQPFLLGAIFKAKGLTTSPFNLDEQKGSHMWRDLERRSAIHGLKFRRPRIFPRNSLLAARIMTAAIEEPWAPEFARAVFEAEFVRDEDIAEENVLVGALSRAGAMPFEWIEKAREPAVRDALRIRTEKAMLLGVFGAPTFGVDAELFWGDDRLEEALQWALRTHPQRV